MAASTYIVMPMVLLRLVVTSLLVLAGAGNAWSAITISGVDAPFRDNILAYLRLDNEPCDAPVLRIRRLFAGADDEIREALEVVGHYSVEIDKRLEYDETCWQASFDISLGEPVILRTVSIEIDTGGIQDSELERAVGECGLNSGDVLQHAIYDACRRRLAQLAENRGYFAAEFTARRIDVFPGKYAADITLHLVTGPRYVFGKITIEQSVLEPDLVERFIRFKPGEPYDASLVRRLQRDLFGSTYFDQVIVTRNPRDDPYFDVPIHLKMTPGKKFQYDAGIGFATDIGPRLRFGVLNRRVNMGGHQVEFDLSLSPVISETRIAYRIPLDKPKDWLSTDVSYKVEDNDSFESDLLIVGVQRIQERDNDWIRTLFLNLRLEDYRTSEIDEDYSRLLTPGISYAFVEEDFPPRPLEGHRTHAQLLGSYEELISDTSFVQVYGNTKWVFDLWPGGRLLTRAEAGFTLIDRLSTLPASVRFFAGGDNSVRGYAYKSLGPTDPFGNVVGGENLLVGSVEVDHLIATNWALAAFVDSGNAFNDLDVFDAVTGVGAGIRWFSPLGPIRFDIAFPLESDAPDEYRIHITLGPDL